MSDEQKKIDFLQNINNKDQFMLDVQSEIKRRAFDHMETMKRDIASTFINPKK